MVRKHNARDYSSHRYDTIRPYDEFYKVEIFSFDPSRTKYYTVAEGNINGSNFKKKSWKSFSVYYSSDNKNNFTLKFDYFVETKGEYRIDFLYETTNENATSGSFNNEDIYFNDVLNELKRKTFYKEFDEGNLTLTLELPTNVYFIGVVVRKIKEFVGDSLDSVGTNLMLKEVETSADGQISPKECSFKIAYDNAFENLLSPSGLYMKYGDEVNVYLKKDGDVDEVRVFGGYLSSILPDNNKTMLTVSCADRLIDGQSNYLMNRMKLLGGTTSQEEDQYESYMDKDFETYGGALKFLCKCFESTLNNNIGKNDLVTGETAKKGFNIEFGKNKKIKKVTAKNSTADFSKNFVTLRNNASGKKKQEIILYNAKDHVTSTPPKITNYNNFGLVYGLGDPKVEYSEKTYGSSSDGDGTAGSQKFSKCGVSEDKNYLMAIGLPSAGKDSKSGWTKTIFKRKCPHCGSTNLIWDWNWGSGKACNGRYEGGSAEGHIFCISCDADYSVQGYEHISGSNYHMEKVSSTVSSSREEAQKLKNGNMTAVPSTATTITSDDIFQAITNKAFKYQYDISSYSTASDLKKHKKGECWAFSEFIFDELKSYKVNCRVVQYPTSLSKQHRSVQYKNKSNEWTDFPYKKYGWDSKFNNMLNSTSGSKNPSSVPFKYLNGGTIASASSKSDTSSSTTTVKVTEGYDKDNPIQGYFEVTVSTEPSLKAKTRTIQVGFTQKAGTTNSITGFSPVWINNTVKQLNVDLLDFIKKSIYSDFNNTYEYYLHTIKFICPVNQAVDSEKSAIEGKTVYTYEDWYTNDDSTKDNSSCKLDLYSINFNDSTTINPTDLESCGKSITNLFEELLGKSKYTAKMVYAKHRCDDIINFSVDNQTEPSFVAMEGDENNILEMNGISYTPRSTLFNNSTVVFKDNSQKYKYIDTKNIVSILEYGEQTTLLTATDITGEKEAYYNALNNTNYNPNETFNFSIIVPYFVPVNVGELIKVISNDKQLNTVKEVKSVKYKCTYKSIPKIQTELGLGELPVDLQIKKELREIRASAKKETTHFSASAEPVLEEEFYEWDN